MKCPNCSFVNTDDIKTCRVCGFELTPAEVPTLVETFNTNGPSKSQSQNESLAKTSKRRLIDDSEDEALDSAFKSIFGVESDIEEDPLDVATVERFLQKKKRADALLLEQPANIPEDSFDEDVASFEADESDPLSKNKIILMVILSGILLILLALKLFWPGLPWKYESNLEMIETILIESTEEVSTTETIFTLGDDTSIIPVNDFFILLPDFINRGNLSILSLFDNSREALEVLTSFAVIGNLEKIAESSLIESEVNSDSAIYRVSTITNRDRKSVV